MKVALEDVLPITSGTKATFSSGAAASPAGAAFASLPSSPTRSSNKLSLDQIKPVTPQSVKPIAPPAPVPISTLMRSPRTLDLLKARNPQKFAEAKKLSDEADSIRGSERTSAIGDFMFGGGSSDSLPKLEEKAKRAAELEKQAEGIFNEIMPDGGYGSRWISNEEADKHGLRPKPQYADMVIDRSRGKPQLVRRDRHEGAWYNFDPKTAEWRLAQERRSAEEQSIRHDVSSSNIIEGINQGNASTAGVIMRAAEYAGLVEPGSADAANRLTFARGNVADSMDSSAWGRAVRSSARSLTQAGQGAAVGLLTRTGPISTIALFAASAGNELYTEAIDAGKTPDEAKRIAIDGAIIEGGITAAFQSAGLGGAEGLFTKAAIRQASKSFHKSFMKHMLSEQVEEVMIASVDNFNRIKENVNPHEWLPLLKDTVLTTALTMGAMQTPSGAVAGIRSARGTTDDKTVTNKFEARLWARDNQDKAKIFYEHVAEGKPISRGMMRNAGLPHGDRSQRDEFARAVALEHLLQLRNGLPSAPSEDNIGLQPLGSNADRPATDPVGAAAYDLRGRLPRLLEAAKQRVRQAEEAFNTRFRRGGVTPEEYRDLDEQRRLARENLAQVEEQAKNVAYEPAAASTPDLQGETYGVGDGSAASQQGPEQGPQPAGYDLRKSPEELAAPFAEAWAGAEVGRLPQAEPAQQDQIVAEGLRTNRVGSPVDQGDIQTGDHLVLGDGTFGTVEQVDRRGGVVLNTPQGQVIAQRQDVKGARQFKVGRPQLVDKTDPAAADLLRPRGGSLGTLTNARHADSRESPVTGFMNLKPIPAPEARAPVSEQAQTLPDDPLPLVPSSRNRQASADVEQLFGGRPEPDFTVTEQDAQRATEARTAERNAKAGIGYSATPSKGVLEKSGTVTFTDGTTRKYKAGEATVVPEMVEDGQVVRPAMILFKGNIERNLDDVARIDHDTKGGKSKTAWTKYLPEQASATQTQVPQADQAATPAAAPEAVGRTGIGPREGIVRRDDLGGVGLQKNEDRSIGKRSKASDSARTKKIKAAIRKFIPRAKVKLLEDGSGFSVETPRGRRLRFVRVQSITLAAGQRAYGGFTMVDETPYMENGLLTSDVAKFGDGLVFISDHFADDLLHTTGRGDSKKQSKRGRLETTVLHELLHGALAFKLIDKGSAEWKRLASKYGRKLNNDGTAVTEGQIEEDVVTAVEAWYANSGLFDRIVQFFVAVADAMKVGRFVPKTVAVTQARIVSGQVFNRTTNDLQSKSAWAASLQHSAMFSTDEQIIKKLPPGRIPQLAAAAQQLKDGLISRAEYASAVERYKPIRQNPNPPVVPSDKKISKWLSADKVEFIGAHRSLPDGTPVGLRIDIPAFNVSIEAGDPTYAITVHGQAKGTSKVGDRIGYTGMASVRNPRFFVSSQKAAINIAAGKAKSPIATVEGAYIKSQERTPPDVSGKEWSQIGFDPERHDHFYDKRTGQPVIGGTEAVLIGSTVYVKNAVGVDPQAPLGSWANPSILYSTAEDAETAGAMSPDEVVEARRAWNVLGTNSPWFKSWFGNSVVVNGDGSAKEVFHGTDAKIDIVDIEKGEWGFHVGTMEQAEERALQKAPLVHDVLTKRMLNANANVMPLYVRLENPVRMKDSGNWTKGEILTQLVENGTLTLEEAKSTSIDFGVSPDDMIFDSKAAKQRVIALLRSKGIDGVVYLNRYEGIESITNDVVFLSDEKYREAHPESQDSYIIFDPSQAKSAIGNRGTFDNANPGLVFSAEQDPTPIWIDNVLDSLKSWQPKGTPAQLMAHIGKTKGANEEAKWIGLDEFLKGKTNVTRDEVAAFVDANRVQLSEKVIDAGTQYDDYQLPGGSEYREMLLTMPVDTRLKNAIYEANKVYRDSIRNNAPEEEQIRLYQIVKDAQIAWSEADRGAYESPHFSTPNILAHVRFNERTVDDPNGPVTVIVREKGSGLGRGRSGTSTKKFASIDEANKFRSVKENGGYDVEVQHQKERVLFLEEVQSDWHQQGRKDGYFENKKSLADDDIEYLGKSLAASGYKFQLVLADKYDYGGPGALNVFGNTEAEVRANALRRINDYARGGVPDAPFKQSWPMLAVKRMIRWAAEHGFDKLAWTTGEQQAERYSLANQVQDITLMMHPEDDGAYGDIVIYGFDNQPLLDQRIGIDNGELERTIGKEAAKKLLDSKPDRQGYKRLAGDGLKVGGDGMKGFYDRMLPTEVGKFAKKFGGKVGTIQIPAKEGAYRPGYEYRAEPDEEGLAIYGRKNSYDDWEFADHIAGNPYMTKGEMDEELSAWKKSAGPTLTDVHSLDITPAMRESAMNGMLMFSTDQEGSQSFKRWFGDSKVVDKNGRPKVLAHATRDDFDTFVPQNGYGIVGWFGSPEFASEFARQQFGWWKEMGKKWEDMMLAKDVRITPVYLSIQKPFDARSIGDISRKQFNDKGGFDKAAAAVASRLGIAPAKLIDGIPKTKYFPAVKQSLPHEPRISDLLSNPVAVEAMKAKGYDGFVATEFSEDVWGAFEPTQVKSQLANSGAFDPNSPSILYSLDPEDRTTVSTRVPTKAGIGRPSYTSELIVNAEELFGSVEAQEKMKSHMDNFINLSYADKDGVPKSTNQLLHELFDSIVENLLWLHDHMAPGVRARAKLWYDGANRIAKAWAVKFDLDPRQVAGILAVLSPQMDWFRNVSLAERAMRVLRDHGHERWSEGMTKWFESWVNASESVSDKEKRRKHFATAMRIRNSGLTLNELDIKDTGFFIRAFDEAYYPRQYRLVTPEGGFGELASRPINGKETEDEIVFTDDGEPLKPGAVTWSGFDTISKTAAIFRATPGVDLMQVLDVKLGGEHKVRNFYNNIIDPNSKAGHVTIDSHAAAAAYIRATSGDDETSGLSMGSKGGSNNETGNGGLYGLVADAYREAAAQRGILPREMQSITWEAIRSLFPAEKKRGGTFKKDIDAVWDRVRNGQTTASEAREEISKYAGGIKQLAWEDDPSGRGVETGGTAFDSENDVALDPNPDNRTPRMLDEEVAWDSVQVNLSAATSSIPGIQALWKRARAGDGMAHRLLQDIAFDNLKNLMAGVPNVKITKAEATGLYGGDVEPSLALTIRFGEESKDAVLPRVKKFADNFNQEMVHVRKTVGKKQFTGTVLPDGSYVTPVVRYTLDGTLTLAEVQAIIKSVNEYTLKRPKGPFALGPRKLKKSQLADYHPLELYGLTVGEKFIEAYYVGDPQDAAAINKWHASLDYVDSLLGKRSRGVAQTYARLWAYGDRKRGGIGWDGVPSYVPAPGEQSRDLINNATTRRVVGYLNRVGDKPGAVSKFHQAPAISKEQADEQRLIAASMARMLDNNLGQQITRKAYKAANKAILEQYLAMPIKVEIQTKKNPDGSIMRKDDDTPVAADFGDGEPYENSAAMRRDVAVNNHLFVYATGKDTFGPPGSDYTDHPLLETAMVKNKDGELVPLRDVNGYPMLYNDVLRAVHDYFAHTLTDVEFGPKGEEAAHKNHMTATPDPWARWAITTETRGQNSWVNFRPGVTSLTASEKGFARQKVGLLPIRYVLTGDAKTDKIIKEFAKTLSRREKLGSDTWWLPKRGGEGVHPAATEEGLGGAGIMFSAESADAIYERPKGGKLGTIGRWLFKAAGDLPGAAFAAKEKMHGYLNSHERQMKFVLSDLRKAVRQVYGEVPKLGSRDWNVVDAVLRGGDPRMLPLPMRDPVVRMRKHVDHLSKAIIESGAASEKLAATIDENMGFYLTRTYRVFSDPDWYKKVPEEIRNRFRAYLQAEYPDLTENQLDQQIGELLRHGTAADTPASILARGKLGAKLMDVLKQRKNLPIQLRELWGEETNPLVNYAASISKMTRVVAAQQFLNEVKDAGLGKWLFTSDDPNIDPQAVVPIAADGSSPMSPLNGLRTYPEVLKAFEDEYKQPQQHPFWRWYFTLNLLAKGGKTVGSPRTQVRNFISNIGMVITLGHWRVGELARAVRAAAPGITAFDAAAAKSGADIQAWRDLHVRLTNLGVIGEDVGIGELKSLLSEAAIENSKFLNNFAVRWAKNLAAGAAQVYQGSDNFWKAYAFFNERASYAKAFPEMTADQLDRIAADNVRNTMPTYSKISKAIKGLRHVPMGNFFSWPAEIVRTSINATILAMHEIADPRTRAIGARRLVGITGATTAGSWAVKMLAMLLGVTPDDDEDKREFVPPWSKNSLILWLEDNYYVDVSYGDPYSYLRKPIMTLLKGGDVRTAIAEAAGELADPFVTEQLLGERIADVTLRGGKTADDREIYNPEDEAGDQAAAIFKHVVEPMIPVGIAAAWEAAFGDEETITEQGKSIDPQTEFIWSLMGARVSKVDVPQALWFKAGDFDSAIGSCDAIFYREATNRGRKSSADLSEAYRRADGARRRNFDRMHQTVHAAMRTGVPEAEVLDILKSRGISKEAAEQLVAGKYEPYLPSPSTMARIKAAPDGERRAADAIALYVAHSPNPQEAQAELEQADRKRFKGAVDDLKYLNDPQKAIARSRRQAGETQEKYAARQLGYKATRQKALQTLQELGPRMK